MSTEPNVKRLKCETGAQFYTRVLDKRPSLMGLHSLLFDSGPYPHEMIEITGDVSTGKTHLAMELLAKCLLPKTYCGVDIGGLDAGAILLDTDHHFSLLRLIQIMEKNIFKADDPHNSSREFDVDTQEKIILDALDKLFILSCYDRSQMYITFHSIQKILQNNSNINLVVVDNITAFYWEKTVKKRRIRKMDLYVQNNLINLYKHTQYFKVCVVYTKPVFFQSKVKNLKPCFINEKITRQIFLEYILETDGVHFANITSSKYGKKAFLYEITLFGFKWNPQG